MSWYAIMEMDKRELRRSLKAVVALQKKKM
jgi:hypothetical protein